MYKGTHFTDDRYAADEKSVNGTVNYLEGSYRLTSVNGTDWSCPVGHSESFCTGRHFGETLEDNERHGDYIDSPSN